MRIYLPNGTLQGKNYILFRREKQPAEMKAVPEKALLHFSQIVNAENGASFPVNFYYFYPLSPHQYLERMIDMRPETPPLLVFMYLTTACRDRCAGCFAQRLHGERDPFTWESIDRMLREFAESGIKAVKFAGRESALSPHLSQALRLTDELGMSSVLITGGDNLTVHQEAIVNFASHLRVSLNASNADLHRIIQNSKKAAAPYATRIRNYEQIINERRKRDLVSGATFLVRPDSIADAFNTSRKAKELGFNYIRFIYLRNLLEDHAEKDRIKKETDDQVERSLELNDPDFQVWNPFAIPEVDHRSLDRTYWDASLYLRVTVFADGKVVACPDYVTENIREDNGGVYGNLHDQPFRDIWASERRAGFISEVQNNLSEGKTCGRCKYHELNQILKFMALQMNFPANS